MRYTNFRYSCTYTTQPVASPTAVNFSDWSSGCTSQPGGQICWIGSSPVIWPASPQSGTAGWTRITGRWSPLRTCLVGDRQWLPFPQSSTRSADFTALRRCLSLLPWTLLEGLDVNEATDTYSMLEAAVADHIPTVTLSRRFPPWFCSVYNVYLYFSLYSIH